MKNLRLYAPMIVLLLLALFTALNISLTEVGLIALAGSVYLHVHAETHR